MPTDAPTLGYYAGIPCHHWDDELPLIGKVLDEQKPAFVVEIGTMYGGFAAFLADRIRPWNGKVLSVDWVEYPDLVAAARPNLTFLKGDIFNIAIQTQIIEQLQRYPLKATLLYCDGGAKKLEFQLLGQYAGVVGVHDYETEISPATCHAWAVLHHRTPLRASEFEALQKKHGGYFVSRFWFRK